MIDKCSRVSLAGPDPLEIDPATYAALGHERTEARLQAFAKSTRVRVSCDSLRLCYAGSDLSHHAADPDLGAYEFSKPVKECDLSDADYANFHCQLEKYDICLEDSWSGYFIARRLAERRTSEPLLLIHLDDHTDMMPTLLSFERGGLHDPHTVRCFEPANPADWSSAIGCGAISIGSWLTALYYLDQAVHVRHLTHGHNRLDDGAHVVVPRTISISGLPHARFVAVDRQSASAGSSLGTYRSGSDPAALFDGLPEGRMLVHVDLDYFVNDYNGNIGAQPELPIGRLRKRASARLDAFLEAMQRHGICPERWVVSTSPGFCSVRHWPVLLAALAKAIPDSGCSQVARSGS